MAILNYQDIKSLIRGKKLNFILKDDTIRYFIKPSLQDKFIFDMGNTIFNSKYLKMLGDDNTDLVNDFRLYGITNFNANLKLKPLRQDNQHIRFLWNKFRRYDANVINRNSITEIPLLSELSYNIDINDKRSYELHIRFSEYALNKYPKLKNATIINDRISLINPFDSVKVFSPKYIFVDDFEPLFEFYLTLK